MVAAPAAPSMAMVPASRLMCGVRRAGGCRDGVVGVAAPGGAGAQGENFAHGHAEQLGEGEVGEDGGGLVVAGDDAGAGAGHEFDIGAEKVYDAEADAVVALGSLDIGDGESRGIGARAAGCGDRIVVKLLTAAPIVATTGT